MGIAIPVLLLLSLGAASGGPCAYETFPVVISNDNTVVRIEDCYISMKEWYSTNTSSTNNNNNVGRSVTAVSLLNRRFLPFYPTASEVLVLIIAGAAVELQNVSITIRNVRIMDDDFSGVSGTGRWRGFCGLLYAARQMTSWRVVVSNVTIDRCICDQGLVVVVDPAVEASTGSTLATSQQAALVNVSFTFRTVDVYVEPVGSLSLSLISKSCGLVSLLIQRVITNMSLVVEHSHIVMLQDTWGTIMMGHRSAAILGLESTADDLSARPTTQSMNITVDTVTLQCSRSTSTLYTTRLGLESYVFGFRLLIMKMFTLSVRNFNAASQASSTVAFSDLTSVAIDMAAIDLHNISLNLTAIGWQMDTESYRTAAIIQFSEDGIMSRSNVTIRGLLGALTALSGTPLLTQAATVSTIQAYAIKLGSVFDVVVHTDSVSFSVIIVSSWPLLGYTTLYVASMVMAVTSWVTFGSYSGAYNATIILENMNVTVASECAGYVYPLYPMGALAGLVALPARSRGLNVSVTTCSIRRATTTVAMPTSSGIVSGFCAVTTLRPNDLFNLTSKPFTEPSFAAESGFDASMATCDVAETSRLCRSSCVLSNVTVDSGELVTYYGAVVRDGGVLCVGGNLSLVDFALHNVTLLGDAMNSIVSIVTNATWFGGSWTLSNVTHMLLGTTILTSSAVTVATSLGYATTGALWRSLSVSKKNEGRGGVLVSSSAPTLSVKGACRISLVNLVMGVQWIGVGLTSSEAAKVSVPNSPFLLFDSAQFYVTGGSVTLTNTVVAALASRVSSDMALSVWAPMQNSPSMALFSNLASVQSSPATAGDGLTLTVSCSLMVLNVTNAGPLLLASGITTSAASVDVIPLSLLCDSSRMTMALHRVHQGSQWRRFHPADVFVSGTSASLSWIAAHASMNRNGACNAAGGNARSATVTHVDREVNVVVDSGSPNPQTATNALGGAAVVGSLISSILGINSGGLTQSGGSSLQTVALSMSIAKQCGETTEDSGSDAGATATNLVEYGQSIVDNPLQVSLTGMGSSNADASGGVLIGDAVLVLVSWIAITVMRQRQTLQNIFASRTDASSTAVLYDHGIRNRLSLAAQVLLLHQPAPFAGSFPLFCQPMITASIALLGTATAASRGLGIMSLILHCALTGILSYRLCVREIPLRRVTSKSHGEVKNRRLCGPSCRLLSSMITTMAYPRTRWAARRGLPRQQARNFFFRYGTWIEELRSGGHYFPVVDIWNSITTAVIGGVTLQSSVVCNGYAEIVLWMLSGVALLYLGALLVVRPYETKAGEVLGSSLQCLALVVCVLNAIQQNAAAAWVALIQSAAASCGSLLAIFIAVVVILQRLRGVFDDFRNDFPQQRDDEAMHNWLTDVLNDAGYASVMSKLSVKPSHNAVLPVSENRHARGAYSEQLHALIRQICELHRHTHTNETPFSHVVFPKKM